MNTDGHGLSEAELRYVTESLGREPKGVIAVAARDRAGNPSVIRNYPLQREGQRWLPFPTLYWLVDPGLHKRIAEIERKGGVREIEMALEEDDALLAAHLDDNKRYAQTRWTLLSEQDQALAEEQGMTGVLRDSGIAGVANHAGIKCLHAQYAFHLAKCDAGTTVGLLLHERYDLLF